jgi:multiple sugar transport system permease protein
MTDTIVDSVQALSQKRPRLSAKMRLRERQGYLFISPWLIGFLAFTLIPIVGSIVLSFTKWSVLRPPEFVGLMNYRTALLGGDRLMWPSIGRSFRYAVFMVPMSLTGSLLVAMLLNQKTKPVALWRTFYFLPTLTPGVAAAILWTWLLNADVGFVNYLLGNLGITGPRWFGSTQWALPGIILIGMWGSVGGGSMIIFLAGLQDIPVELVEAADIDGAGRLRKFWNITLPILSPVIFFNLIIGIIGALRVFETAFVATAGGPARSTWFISLHIYATAFQYFDFGYAAALAWILVVIIVSMTVLQFRLAKSWVFYQGE